MGSHVKPHAVAQIPPRKESYRTDVPREDERESVAAPRALHPRLRVEPARRVAAAQQIVAGKGHLLAEEVEVVREAEVAAERRARPVARVVRGPRGLRRRWPELVASYQL